MTASNKDIIKQSTSSPIPSVRDAILDLDRSNQRVNVKAVRAKLKELRGFDASPRAVSKEVSSWEMELVQIVIKRFNEFEETLKADLGGPSRRAYAEVFALARRVLAGKDEVSIQDKRGLLTAAGLPPDARPLMPAQAQVLGEYLEGLGLSIENINRIIQSIGVHKADFDPWIRWKK